MLKREQGSISIHNKVEGSLIEGGVVPPFAGGVGEAGGFSVNAGVEYVPSESAQNADKFTFSANELLCSLFYLSSLEDDKARYEARRLSDNIQYFRGFDREVFLAYSNYFEQHNRFPEFFYFISSDPVLKSSLNKEAYVPESLPQFSGTFSKYIRDSEVSYIMSMLPAATSLDEKVKLTKRLDLLLQGEVKAETTTLLSSQNIDIVEHTTKRVEEGCLKFPVNRLNEYGNAVGPGHTVTIMGGPASGKCLNFDSRIGTQDGYLKIGDVCKGIGEGFTARRILVQTPKGMAYTSHLYKESRCRVLHLRLSDGTEVCGTEMHPIEGYSLNGLELKELGKFKIGDYVIKSRYVVTGGSSKFTTEDLYWYGVVLGDGYFRFDEKRGYVSSISLTAGNSEFLKQFRNYLRIDGAIVKSKKSNACTTSICKNNMSKKDRGLPLFDLVGEGGNSHTKTVSEEVFKANVQGRVAWLRGIIDTDGCVGEYSIDILMRSKAIIDSVEKVCESLGLEVYRSIKMVAPRKGAERTPCFRISIHDHTRDSFSILRGGIGYKKLPCGDMSNRNTFYLCGGEDFRQISFYFGHKKRCDGYKYNGIASHMRCRNYLTENMIFRVMEWCGGDNDFFRKLGVSKLLGKNQVKVVGITETFEDVYDITMDTPEHTFYSQGCVNHNTTVALNIAFLNSVLDDKNTLYLYFEDMPERYQYNIFSRYSYHIGRKIASNSLKRGINSSDHDAINELTEVQEYFRREKKGEIYYIGMNQLSAEPEYFAKKLASIITELKIDILITDYIQKVKTFMPQKRHDIMDYQNQIASVLTLLALGQYGNPPCINIMLSQLNREGQKKATRTRGKMSMFDGAEISTIERDSMLVIGVYSDQSLRDSGDICIQILKNRDNIADVTTDLTFFDPAYCIVGDLKEQDDIIDIESMCKCWEAEFSSL